MSPTQAHSDPRSHETGAVIAAAMVIGTSAMLVLGLQPILLGGLTEAGRLSAGQLGQAAMIEILGLAVGASLGPYVMNTGGMRSKTALASGLLALVNLGFLAAPGAWTIIGERALAGLLEGVLLGVVNLVLTHTSRPDRMNGLLLGASTIPQVIAAYLLPVYVIPRFGVGSGFALLALFAILAGVVSLLLPDRVVAAHGSEAPPPVRWTPPLIAFTTAAFLQNAGIGAAWNYIERLGAQHHLPPTAIGAAVSGSLAFQVGGAFVTAWIGWRLPARRVLILGAFFQAAVVLELIVAQTPAIFIAAASLFGLFWLALQPYQLSEIIRLDPTRRVALMLTPIALLGLSVGPLLISFAVREADVTGGFRSAAALLIGAGVLYLVAILAARRRLEPDMVALG